MSEVSTPSPWPGTYAAAGMRTSQVAQGVITGNTTASLNEITQIEKGLVWFQPQVAPLLRLLTKLKRPRIVENARFYHQEQQRMPRTGVVGTRTGGDQSPTAIAVGSNEGVRFRVNDTVYNQNTGDMALVTAVVGDVLTITSNVGDASPSATSWNTSDVILNVGNAYLDGSGAGAPIHVIEDEKLFYLQIFKDSIDQSDRYTKTALYSGDPWTNARKQCEFEHTLSQEYAMFFGKPSIVRDSVTGKLRTTMGGLKHYVNVNEVDLSSGTISKTFIDIIMSEAMRLGHSGFENREMATKTLFCSQKYLNIFNQLAEGKWQIVEPSIKTYGLKISQLTGSWGTVNLINSPVLNQPGFQGNAFLVDLEHLRPATFKGRDTKFVSDIQAPDADSKKGTYISDRGLVVEVTPSHTAFVGLP